MVPFLEYVAVLMAAGALQFEHCFAGPAIPFVSVNEMYKCRTVPNVCPNADVTFFLYTREHQKTPHQLSVANISIDRAPFVRGRPIVLLIHGYTGNHDYSPNTEIRPAYFRDGEYNIISVDYGPLAPEPCYMQAVQNLPVVANCTAQLLDTIIERRRHFRVDDIHVIGFSLGAQTAGMVGNYIKSGRLKRITGLDPAKPLFVLARADHRLGKADAEFVDVIHTDILQRGILQPIGHADFYVNGGIEQPGCKYSVNESTGGCNHARAPQYYAESISSDDGFWGFHCREWVYWAMGLCRPAKSTELAIMGKRTSKDARGLFFVYTNKEPPYAKGILPEFMVTDISIGLENATEVIRTTAFTN